MIDGSRRTFLSGCAAALLGAAALPGRALAQPAMPVPQVPHRHHHVRVDAGSPEHARVALTFDDGPHPRLTPRLLDILRARRVRATFYLIGNRVRAYPLLARRIVEEGHEIGNHTWEHPVLSRQGADRVLREVDRCARVVYETVGHVPVTMRPPYGMITARQAEMVFAERNMPTVMWSVDPEDWRGPGAAAVTRRILRAARPGAIILSHEIHAGTIAAMPATIDGLLAQGLRLVPISTMLGWEPWGPRPSPLRLAAAGT